MSSRTLWAFLAIAFGQAWGLAALPILFPAQIEAVFGPIGYSNPLFILAVYSPAIAGLLLVWRHHGIRGMGRYLTRLGLWRMPAAWWAFLVLGIPAIFYAGAAIKGTLGDPFPFAPWYSVLPALALALALGPVEELGWRGLALPLLQRRFAPLWSSLILGAIWGAWHLPAFFLDGTPQSAWVFGPYLLGVMSISVILTPMFNSARGSLLIAGLYHFQLNGPVWPDAQPWDSVLFAVLAVIVIIINREKMLSRDAGITDVIPARDATSSAL